MSDKIKRAARQRQRETGEAYSTARRRVIAEYEAAQGAQAAQSAARDAESPATTGDGGDSAGG